MSGIIKLTCKNCGGNIKINGQEDYSYCEYCNTKYLIIQNETQIEITKNMENVIKKCDELMYKGKYTNIRKYSEFLLKTNPNDFRGLFYEGVSKINNSDSSSYDELWAEAISKCDDPYWIKKMHTDIPCIIIRMNFEKNREELEFTNVNIPLLTETTDAFDTYSPDPYTGDTLYTQMITEIYKIANEDLSLNAYYALVHILDNTISATFLMDLFDYDYVEQIFRSSHKVMNVIINKLPIFPETIKYDPRRNYWCRIKMMHLIFRLLDEGLTAKSEDMDERKLRSLNRKHQDYSDKCFDLLADTTRYIWELNIFDNDGNKDLVKEYKKKTDRLIDAYLTP